MNGSIDTSLQAQRDYALVQLKDLKRRGRQIRDALVAEPVHAPSLAAARAWQQACASAIHQLAGGSKAHWLSRAYSGALLVRSADGFALVEPDVAAIVDRILAILEQAGQSLSQMDDVAVASSAAAPPRRRFEFVHNPQLRPVLEQAFIGSGHALADGDFTLSLVTSCGILEAIITDALEEHARPKPSRYEDSEGLTPSRDDVSENLRRAKALAEPNEPNDPPIAEWSFDARITAAERAGLIRGGCARLPPSARAYRDGAEADGAPDPAGPMPAGSISERDATLARQVLHVVMRDLDPGR